MDFVNQNGSLIEKSKACLPVDDHSYRYGDGLFETMKVKAGKILLADLHFERLFHGFDVLQFQIPQLIRPVKLQEEILTLCKKNQCETLARVRLSFSGGQGGLYDGDEKCSYLIECWPLSSSYEKMNENGLIIDVYAGTPKSCDRFSNLKSANFLPYVMAARFAKQNKLNDCLVMNVQERICDSTMANVFWIKDKKIFTPPLTEGCVAGVMRKYLMQKVGALGYKVEEKICEIHDLENADEIFLTNAIRKISWVKQFSKKTLANKITSQLNELI